MARARTARASCGACDPFYNLDVATAKAGEVPDGIEALARQGGFNDVPPNNLTHCHQTIFPVDGRGTPVSPGTVIEYKVESLYSRPWAAIWEEYFEQGMQRPVAQDLFDFD